MPSLAKLARLRKLNSIQVKETIATEDWEDLYLANEHYIAPRTEHSAKSHPKIRNEIDLAEDLDSLPLTDRERDLLREELDGQILYLPCCPSILLIWAKFKSGLSLHPSFVKAVTKRFNSLDLEADAQLHSHYALFNTPNKNGKPTNKRRKYTSQRLPETSLSQVIEILQQQLERIPWPKDVVSYLQETAGKNGAIFIEYDDDTQEFITSDQQVFKKSTIETWTSDRRKLLNS